MSSYRPITDTWFLARARLTGGIKFYGAYPGGFLLRARALLGVQPDDPVLHVCGGRVRNYPYPGFGPNDRTLDLDPATAPDILGDARDPYPTGFRAILADSPYSELHAERYSTGAGAYPPPRVIVRRVLDALPVGGRVGILHTVMPRPPPKAARLVAAVTVLVGYDNVVRVFTVYEKGEGVAAAR
jgi:hypothetical protein